MRWLSVKPEFALTLPLGVLCAVLALVLVLQSVLLDRNGAGRVQPADASAQGPSPGDGEPDEVFELPDVEEFSAFVDRPLFMEGRKPVPPEAEHSEVTRQEDTTPLNLQLMGVMLTPRGEMAILAESTGKNRRVRMGGTINGWRLAEIKPDRAVLQRGEERKELALLKPKPKPKGPPAQAAAGQAPTPGGQPPGSRRAGQPPAGPPPELTEPEAEVEEIDEPAPAEAGDVAEPEGEEE